MKTFRQINTSGWVDSYRNLICDHSEYWNNWLVLLTKSRDSDNLTISNFETAFKQLGENPDNVEVRRFGHWACGWFEVILINPECSEAVCIAERIESDLADYPLLDEDDYYNRQFEQAADYWDSQTISQKIGDIDGKESIFSARANFSELSERAPYTYEKILCYFS